MSDWFRTQRAPQMDIGKCDLCNNDAVFIYASEHGTYKRCPTHSSVRDWDDLTVTRPATGPQEQR